MDAPITSRILRDRRIAASSSTRETTEPSSLANLCFVPGDGEIRGVPCSLAEGGRVYPTLVGFAAPDGWRRPGMARPSGLLPLEHRPGLLRWTARLRWVQFTPHRPRSRGDCRARTGGTPACERLTKSANGSLADGWDRRRRPAPRHGIRAAPRRLPSEHCAPAI